MDGLLEMSIMKIPQIGFEQLDSRVVNHIKRIHTANGFSAVQTVENTEKKDKKKKRKLNDLAEDYARESKEAFWNAHAYGRVDGVQKYVQGVNVGGIIVNLQELILQVNRDVDDIFENGDIQHWLNRALDDITPIARIEKRAMLEYPYTLPSDVQDIERVMQTNTVFPRIPVGEEQQQGYWVWGNELVLQGGSQQPIEVYYYKSYVI